MSGLPLPQNKLARCTAELGSRVSSDLHIAVVVPSVAAVARVHQDSIKPIHDGVTAALRHVRTDVQELWIANILFRKGKGTRKRQGTLTQENKGHSPFASITLRNVCFDQSLLCTLG